MILCIIQVATGPQSCTEVLPAGELEDGLLVIQGGGNRLEDVGEEATVRGCGGGKGGGGQKDECGGGRDLAALK